MKPSFSFTTRCFYLLTAVVLLLGLSVFSGNAARACALCGNPNHLAGTPLPPIAPTNVLSGGGTSSLSASGFTINVTAGSGLSSNAAAMAAVQRAAARWTSLITSPITINLSMDLTTSGFASSNIIGQTQNTFVYDSFDTVRNAMAAQGGVDAALPTQAQFNAQVNAGMTLNNTFLIGTSANFKALGFTAFNYANLFPNPYDGTITLNSAFNFDYDSRDGVSAGAVDFETTVAHEIGHVLGFTSVVDDADYFASHGNPTATVYARPLDLFRFSSAAAPTSLADFTTGVRELRSGAAATFSDTQNSYAMATGAYTGDGSQASHWKDDGTPNGAASLNGGYIGLMDPSLPSGLSEPITLADTAAFRALGYRVVLPGAAAPEPSAVLLVFPTLLGVGGWSGRKTGHRPKKRRLLEV